MITSIPLVDIIGISVYLVSMIIFLIIAWRVREVLAYGESSVARALLIAALGYATYSVYVALRLFVQYELTWLKPFVWSEVSFVMRFIFMFIGIAIWRSMQPNGR